MPLTLYTLLLSLSSILCNLCPTHALIPSHSFLAKDVAPTSETAAATTLRVHSISPNVDPSVRLGKDVETADRAIIGACQTHTKIVTLTKSCHGSGTTHCAVSLSKTRTTSCHNGLHSPPTFRETPMTLTETITTAGSTKTKTIQATAEVSVKIPKPSDGPRIKISITPKMRTDLVKLGNSFCGKKNKRQESFELTCRLPDSAQDNFMREAAELLEGRIEMPSASQLQNLPAAVQAALPFQELVGGQLLPALVFTSFTGGVVLSLYHEAEPQRVDAAVKKIKQGQTGGSKPTTKAATTKSTSHEKAPTMIPGPPNQAGATFPSADVAAITQYLASLFDSLYPQPTKLPCSHGAAPNVINGAAGYCQCTDGKIYPTSPSTQSTTINGKATVIMNDCPYTKIPSKTTDPFHNGKTTAVPSPTTSKAKLTSTVHTTLPHLRSGTRSCYSGGGLFFKTDITTKVSSFCSDASQFGYTGTYDQIAQTTQASNGGSKLFKYSDVKSSEGKALSLQFNFISDACELNANHTQFVDPQVDFRKNGGKWCRDNFMAAIEFCPSQFDAQPVGKPWKNGGFRYNDCVEWIVKAS